MSILKYVKSILILFVVTCSSFGEVKTVTLDTEEFGTAAPQVDFARDLFNIDSTNSGEVSNSHYISYLISSGLLNSAEFNLDSSAVNLNFGLAVRDVKIEGSFPLFSSEITAVMTVISCDFITEKLLETQELLVREKLTDNGVSSATVELRVEPLEEYPGLANLIVEISDEEFQLVDKVNYRGSEIYGNIRHGIVFGHYHYQTLFLFPRRFSRDDLRDDQRSLRDFYRNRGYGDVMVSVSDSLVESREDGGERVELNVLIDHGVATRVEFGEIAPFRKRYIRDYFDITESGNRNDGTVKRGKRTLQKELRALGYRSGSVELSDTVITRGVRYPWECRYITVSVDTNSRTMLDSITFSGNEAIATDELRTVILTREGRVKKSSSQGTFSPLIFEDDIEAIENLYRSKGFLNVDINQRVEYGGDSLNRTAAAEIRIDENKPCVVTELTVTGLDDPNFSALRDSVRSLISNRQDSTLIPSAIFMDRIEITRLLKEMGFPFAEVVESEEYNDDFTEVTLNYNIEPYHSAVVGKVIYWGNFATQKRLLDETMNIVEGEPFSLMNINEGIRNIRNLGLFSTVSYSIPEAVNKGDTLDVIVLLEENKSITLSGSVGYETEQRIYVKGSFLKDNLWGLNKSLLMEANFSSVEKGLTATFTEPNLFNSGILGSVSLYGKKEDKQNTIYTTNTLGNRYMLGFDIRNAITLSLTSGVEAKKNDGVTGTYVDTIDGTELIVTDSLRYTLLFQPKLTLDFRDSFVRPTRGGYLRTSSEISKGLNVTLDDYWKLESEGKFYFTIFSRITIAMRARLGTARPYGDNSYVPSDELFYLGGTSSVRGYDENMLFSSEGGKSLPGMNSYDGSIEIRPQVVGNIEIPLFLDFGALGFTSEFVDMESPKMSAGSGIRYLSPIGPIGLVYGVKLDQLDREDVGAFHFSIGYTF